MRAAAELEGAVPPEFRRGAMVLLLLVVVLGMLGYLDGRLDNRVQFFKAQIVGVTGDGSGVCLTRDMEIDIETEERVPNDCYSSRLRRDSTSGLRPQPELARGDRVRVGVVRFVNPEESGSTLLLDAVPLDR